MDSSKKPGQHGAIHLPLKKMMIQQRSSAIYCGAGEPHSSDQAVQLVPSAAHTNRTSTFNCGGSASGVEDPNAGLRGSTDQFPWRLHKMLHDAEMNGNESIVSWLPNGRAFRVNSQNKDEFVSKIMPIYFNQTHYKSFQRQLNLWGFSKVRGRTKKQDSKDCNKGIICHEFFVKGRPELCYRMSRIKIKGLKKENGSTAALPPPSVAVLPFAPSAASARDYSQQNDHQQDNTSTILALAKMKKAGGCVPSSGAQHPHVLGEQQKRQPQGADFSFEGVVHSPYSLLRLRLEQAQLHQQQRDFADLIKRANTSRDYLALVRQQGHIQQPHQRRLSIPDGTSSLLDALLAAQALKHPTERTPFH